MFQTFTARQYLMIDISNNYGLDKEDWDVRLDWFKTNEHQLDALLTTAEEPALYYAGVKAYRDVLAGKPIGYPISLDATSSGIQILSVLTGDRSAAQLCNVIDTGHREDAYTNIYNMMLARTGGSSKINRKDTKQAIMTSFYTSTAMPKKVFGEGELLALFYEILQTVAPAAWELNQTMPTLWNPEALSHDWILPDNFHVKTKVMDTVSEKVHFDEQPFDVTYRVNQPQEQGRSLGANATHSIDGLIVREMVRRCNYDPKKIDELCTLIENSDVGGMSAKTHDDRMVMVLWDRYNETGYLSARILDHLNEDNFGLVAPSVISDLLESLPAKPFKIMTIHDAFRCLPQYGNDLRWQYNLQLKLIAESDILSSIISQLVGRRVQIGKLDPTLHLDIMESNYALS